MNVKEYASLVASNPLAARQIAMESSLWFDLLRLYPEFKGEMALNKQLPDDILLHMAKDDNNDIRFTIAMKRRLPNKAYEILSVDEDESIRMQIALNPNVPTYILEGMMKDSWGDIVEIVNNRLKSDPLSK